MFDRHQVATDPVYYPKGEWFEIKLEIDAETKTYNALINSKVVRENIPFANDVEVSSLERIVFRTGPYRGYTDAVFAEQGAPSAGGLTIEDLPAAGEKLKPNVYWLDNINIKKIK